VLPAIHHCIHTLQLHDANKYGFKSTYNPTYVQEHGKACGWVSPWHFGLNLGPIVLMVENHRSGMLWELTRKCPWIVDGLRRAGFTGGWLTPL
jgi:hypothetical protein